MIQRNQPVNGLGRLLAVRITFPGGYGDYLITCDVRLLPSTL